MKSTKLTTKTVIKPNLSFFKIKNSINSYSISVQKTSNPHWSVFFYSGIIFLKNWIALVISIDSLLPVVF
jgi:hypothetical protein